MYMLNARKYFNIYDISLNNICECLCENQPYSHLVVIRETLVYKVFESKLTALACARPLLLSRTGLSNVLN